MMFASRKARLFVGSIVFAVGVAGAGTSVLAQDKKKNGEEEQSDDSKGKSADSSDATGETIEGPSDFEYVIGDGEVTVRPKSGETSSFRVPCSEAAAATSSRLYVACGDERVLTLSLEDPADPEPTGIRSLGKRVVDLYTVKDDVWVEFPDGSAEPIGTHLPSDGESDESEAKKTDKSDQKMRSTDKQSGSKTDTEAKSDDSGDGQSDQEESSEETGGEEDEQEGTEDEESSKKKKRPREVEPVGKVIKQGDGFVVIDGGSEDDIEEGDTFQFWAVRKQTVDEEVVSSFQEKVGAGRATAVGDQKTKVTLKMHERAPMGALARPADVDMDPEFSPDRLGGLFVLKGAARPFLPIGSFGIGSLIDAQAAYYFEPPFALEMQLAPFGFTATETDNDVVSIATNFIASYDSKFVQAGIGLGFAQLDGFDDYFTLSAVQKVRFGTRDGTNFTGTTHFVLAQDGWRFGGIRMSVLAPTWDVLEDTWSITRFRSGVPGQTFFETGLRILTYGNGTGRSTYITPLIGYASVRSTIPPTQGENTDEQITYDGPLVGFEFEQRF